jgi:hypothetical protein
MIYTWQKAVIEQLEAKLATPSGRSAIESSSSA